MMRFCADIGMFVIDRDMASCLYSTQFCRDHCYNLKFFKMYPNVRNYETKLEYNWMKINGLQEEIKRKRKSTSRIRLCSRGEPFAYINDVFKILKVCECNPDTVFWAPTRAWRSDIQREAIERELFPIDNIRLQASLDPTNTVEEIQSLKDSGWSTIFFGDDSDIQNRELCPKTWEKKKGGCSTCNLCFSKERVDIHLKMH